MSTDHKDPYATVRLPEGEAPKFWRSVEQLDGHAEVKKQEDAEFPSGITLPDGFSRRDSLKLAGASLAMGALVGCDKLRRPREEILPFVRPPEQVIPGNRLNYATAMQRSEGAMGLTVEANEGRPTKIEGNPNHPASLGASDVWAQAEVMKLYDPERATVPLKGGAASTWAAWDSFATELAGSLGTGKGLALVAEELNGPTFERLLKALSAKYPDAKVYRFDPLAPTQSMEGASLAFGPGARLHYDLLKAKVLFSLDSDFLVSGPDNLRLAREFASSRAVQTAEDAKKMNRLYAAEGVFSTTGSNADHRIRMASGQGVDALKALGKVLAASGVDVSGVASALEGATVSPEQQKFLAALGKDLAANRGACAILVGERQPAPVHALAAALNVALGNVASGAVKVTVDAEAPGRAGIAALTAALAGGEVTTLVLCDVNPLYTAPGALKFADAYAKAKTVIHLGVLPEETGAKATWHLPVAHFLESWGDARAWDGTVSMVQPLILPIHGSRPALSILAQLAGEAETLDRALVEATWRGAGMPLEANKAWRKALHDGVVAGSAYAVAAVELKASEVAQAAGAQKSTTPSRDALEVVTLHGHLKDGRLSSVTWLQELPDGMSKLCWDNALMVSPALAKELGLSSKVYTNAYTSDVVTLTAEGRTITVPTFVLPGLAPYTAAINLGYGKGFGDIAQGVGVDARPLTADSTGVVQGVKLTKTGAQQILCSTQDHFSMPVNPMKEVTFAQMTALAAGAADRKLGLGERPHFMVGTSAQYATDAESMVAATHAPANTMVQGLPRSRPSQGKQPTQDIVYEGQQWGMVIDLSTCIGCNVCTVACQSENNIAVVGREQVLLGRELHWIRIDRYYSGDVDSPDALHQPVACTHCENAPCEPVCPVSATVHDEEGINSMAYNRCIGTRYCANNCPFKVRRFNYLDFTHTGNVHVDPVWQKRMNTLKLQRNPDVTVRYRGIMEKCSYCTQRVEEAKVALKREGGDRKALPDGAVTPACAQACPTQAITFGNINDETSRVAKLKVGARNYELMEELNIRPRTSYLAHIKNVNEELA